MAHQEQLQDERAVAGVASSMVSTPSFEQGDVYQAMKVLKEEERTCITLQLIEGYAIDEIASMTQMPAGTVKSHLKRGKEKLANYLRQNGYDR